MAQSHREVTPLLELGDQDSPRFDDLARLHMATFEADCGKVAIQRAAIPLDLAILDYRLPDLDGLTEEQAQSSLLQTGRANPALCN